MIRNQDVDTLLRTLDAADHRGPANTQRARTDLYRILSTDPAQRPTRTTAGKDRQPRRNARSAARRVAVVGGMVAVATAGMIIVPSLSGGDPAFASWTPLPPA